MDRLNVIHCIRQRAHLYGADAVVLEKEADVLAAGPLPATIDDCTDDQLRALLVATQAHKARQRYYRELEAVNILMGRGPSLFAGLG